ncbi:recombinase family protein [Streptomyces sp. NPDC048558]|uniref:recombinase family protein n=1 Tax=Streptomyces sp. NPDC048558 TaxID=3155759 RepID=UPI0033D7C484
MNQHAVRDLSELIPVVSYARTSEHSKQRDGHGVRYQLRINERTAHEQGCIVVAAYSDNGRSASKEGVLRPGFDRLVADLARGHIDSGQRTADSGWTGWSASLTTGCIAARRISRGFLPR